MSRKKSGRKRPKYSTELTSARNSAVVRRTMQMPPWKNAQGLRAIRALRRRGRRQAGAALIG